MADPLSDLMAQPQGKSSPPGILERLMLAIGASQRIHGYDDHALENSPYMVELGRRINPQNWEAMLNAYSSPNIEDRREYPDHVQQAQDALEAFSTRTRRSTYGRSMWGGR